MASAAPGSAWTGAGSDAYAQANAARSRALGDIGDVDLRLGAEINHWAAVVAAGRRDLDAVRQWVGDAAASVPATKAGDPWSARAPAT